MRTPRPQTFAPTSYAGIASKYATPGLLWLPSIQPAPLIGASLFTSGAALNSFGQFGKAARFSVGNNIVADYSPLSPSNGGDDDFPHTLLALCSMSSLAWQTLIAETVTSLNGRIQQISATNAGILNLGGAGALYAARANELLNIVISAAGYSSRTVIAVNGRVVHSATSSRDTRVQSMYIGRRKASDSENWTGPLYLLAVLPQALNEAQTQDLSRNCFRLLRPTSFTSLPEYAGTAAATYTLTQATYVPGSLTSTSVTPRIVRTKA